MHQKVNDFLEYFEATKGIGNKEKLTKEFVDKFSLIQDRKVFYCEYFAVRFSYSAKGVFSNTILSLSKLEKYDRIPFFVVLVKGSADNTIYLANSTFLQKISHSSQSLSMTNIRGSFNGGDIMKSYNDINNEPSNFEELFVLHSGLDWKDNLQRLVDASSKIKPVSTKFNPTDIERENIFASVERAKNFVSSPDFIELNKDLNERCDRAKEAIIAASHIDNVNIRGRLIEALITADEGKRMQLLNNLADIEQALPTYDSRNGLGDYTRSFATTDAFTDIKTKVIYLNSNPKMFNIDKFLQCMAEDKSVFLFYFIGIDVSGIQKTVLCSVYSQALLGSIQLQHHWAGRSTRGVAQAKGESINRILECGNGTDIEEQVAKTFLETLLQR